jgi:type II secretory pathway pseudopilin PulG
MKSHPCSTYGGFTLTNVLVTVAIIGVLATGAFRSISSTNEGVLESKLQGDVKSINAAINVYETFGGNIPEDATPAQVLAKLKSKSSALTREQTNGVTGSLVDPRLKAIVMAEGSGGEGQRPVPRAVWNAEKQRFSVSTSGSGI